jgi:hypothetical protein
MAPAQCTGTGKRSKDARISDRIIRFFFTSGIRPDTGFDCLISGRIPNAEKSRISGRIYGQFEGITKTIIIIWSRTSTGTVCQQPHVKWDFKSRLPYKRIQIYTWHCINVLFCLNRKLPVPNGLIRHRTGGTGTGTVVGYPAGYGIRPY